MGLDIEERLKNMDRLGLNDSEKIAVALLEVANAIRYAARELGNGDAATRMGAMEALGAVAKEGFTELAMAISESSHHQ